MPSLRVARQEITSKGKRHNIVYAILHGNHAPLLGRQASESLGLVKRVNALQIQTSKTNLNVYADYFPALVNSRNHITLR